MKKTLQLLTSKTLANENTAAITELLTRYIPLDDVEIRRSLKKGIPFWSEFEPYPMNELEAEIAGYAWGYEAGRSRKVAKGCDVEALIPADILALIRKELWDGYGQEIPELRKLVLEEAIAWVHDNKPCVLKVLWILTGFYIEGYQDAEKKRNAKKPVESAAPG